MRLKLRRAVSIGLFFTLSSAIGAAPGDAVRAMRFKLSAGDLLSAESILEVHRAESGTDGEYMTGIAWLARGAAALGAWKEAAIYAQQARELATPLLPNLAAFDTAPQAAYALGTAIDVEAQCRNQASGKDAALRYLEEEVGRHANAPAAFRSRIWRQWDLLGLAGRPAPAFDIETSRGPAATPIQAMKGKPVVLFMWASWCGDCRDEAATFSRIVNKYRQRDVQFLAVTRLYDTDRAKALNEIDKVWHEAYKGLESVPIAVSEQAMVRYGVSATPTFVFIDRAGRVQDYVPSRMTEARLSTAIDAILK